MNHHIVPDFELDEDGAIPSSSGFYHQKYHKMPEDELVELLWQNGQVVMQNQTQRPLRKSVPPPPRFHLEDTSSLLHHVLPQKPAASSAADVGPSSVPEQQLYIQEDEMASWLQYPLEDTFDRDFCTDLLYPQASSSQTPAAAADRRAENKPTASSSSSKLPPIPPPRRVEHEADKTTNFALFSRLKGKAQAEHRPSVSENIGIASTVVDSSVTPAATAAPVSRVLPADWAAMASGGNVGSGSTCEREGGTCDPTVTSSSGGSGASADRSSKPPDSHSRKRKAREADEFEGLSEDAEFDFIEEKKASRRSSSARRTRAAEVHNLSERRRRDRINEKMKALQELIPHCNKSDKASMLDEAIEYLKSLQLQVQMMSMGCGMGPMVFPGVQHYMSPMGMGMGMGVGMGMGIGMDMSSGSLNRPMLPFPPVLPPTPMHGAATHLGPRLPIPPFCMPHIPLSDQSRVQVTGQTDPVFNMVGLQIPNAQQPMNLADPYQHFLNFHHMAMPPLSQTAAPPPSGSKGTEALDSKKSG